MQLLNDFQRPKLCLYGKSLIKSALKENDDMKRRAEMIVFISLLYSHILHSYYALYVEACLL